MSTQSAVSTKFLLTF